MKWKTAQGSDRLTKKYPNCGVPSFKFNFILLNFLLPALKSTERLKDSALQTLTRRNKETICVCVTQSA